MLRLYHDEKHAEPYKLEKKDEMNGRKAFLHKPGFVPSHPSKKHTGPGTYDGTFGGPYPHYPDAYDEEKAPRGTSDPNMRTGPSTEANWEHMADPYALTEKEVRKYHDGTSTGYRRARPVSASAAPWRSAGNVLRAFTNPGVLVAGEKPVVKRPASANAWRVGNLPKQGRPGDFNIPATHGVDQYPRQNKCRERLVVGLKGGYRHMGAPKPFVPSQSRRFPKPDPSVSFLKSEVFPNGWPYS